MPNDTLVVSNPNSTELPMGGTAGEANPASSSPVTPNAPAPEGERPKWLPEKFKTPEAMAEAYGHLEQKMLNPKGENDGNNNSDSGDNTSTLPNIQLPNNEPGLETEGLISQQALHDYTQSFQDKGSLSEEQYKELAVKYKLDKGMVDGYIAGQVALTESFNNKVYSEAGGTEQDLVDLTQWASTNAEPTDIQAYNEALQSGDANKVIREIGILKAKAVAAGAYDNEGRIYGVGGGSSPESNVGFKSSEAYQIAMADPKYQTSEDYRQEVIAKLRVSTWRQR